MSYAGDQRQAGTVPEGGVVSGVVVGVAHEDADPTRRLDGHFGGLLDVGRGWPSLLVRPVETVQPVLWNDRIPV